MSTFQHKARHGAQKGASDWGLNRPQIEDYRRTYESLNTDEARGAYADVVIRILADGFENSWSLLYDALSRVRDRESYKDPVVMPQGKVYATFAEYFTAVVGRPFDEWGELEATHHFVAECKPELFEKSFSEAVASRRQANAIEKAKENQEPLAPHGVNQYKKDDKDDLKEEVIKSQIITSSERGTAASYRIKRLRRDHPEIAARLEKGEFKSVSAAERASRGLPAEPPRRVPSALEIARRMWARMTASERLAFLSEVTGPEHV